MGILSGYHRDIIGIFLQDRGLLFRGVEAGA